MRRTGSFLPFCRRLQAAAWDCRAGHLACGERAAIFGVGWSCPYRSRLRRKRRRTPSLARFASLVRGCVSPSVRMECEGGDPGINSRARDVQRPPPRAAQAARWCLPNRVGRGLVPRRPCRIPLGYCRGLAGHGDARNRLVPAFLPAAASRSLGLPSPTARPAFGWPARAASQQGRGPESNVAERLGQ